MLYDDNGAVKGVATGNLGVGKDGEPHDGFQLGMELHGKYTVFAEGARGHLGKQLIASSSSTKAAIRRATAIGIKELWEVDRRQGQPGLVVHTAGWPMDRRHFGGGFLYHLDDNKVTLRLRDRPGLREPVAEPVRGDAALEDAPGDPQRTSKAASASATARAPSTTARRNACPRRCSPAARWSAATPAT